MKLYTVTELAERWGMTRQGVLYLVANGRIKAQKVGRQWVMTEEEVARVETKRKGKKGIYARESKLGGADYMREEL